MTMRQRFACRQHWLRLLRCTSSVLTGGTRETLFFCRSDEVLRIPAFFEKQSLIRRSMLRESKGRYHCNLRPAAFQESENCGMNNVAANLLDFAR